MRSAKFTNPEHTMGEFVLADGTVTSGPMPPLGGVARDEFVLFIEDGGVVAPFVGPALDDVKARLRAAIDTAAEAERLKYITPGAGQAMVYEAKRTEVARWHSLGDPLNPSPDLFPWAAGRSKTFGLPVKDVLLEWSLQADGWAGIGIAIEAVRETAKAAIAAAKDEAAARAVVAGVTWPAP
jgi:hypothetical protein